MNTLRTLALSLAVILSPSLLPEARGADEPAAAQDTREEKRERILRRLEILRATRLAEELKLDAVTEARLLPLVKKFADKRADLTRKRGLLLKDIKAEMDASAPDGGKLTRLMDQAAAMGKEIHGAWQEEYSALKGTLTPLQLARYYRFEKEFQKDVRHLIRDVRKGKGMKEKWQERRQNRREGSGEDSP